MAHSGLLFRITAAAREARVCHPAAAAVVAMTAVPVARLATGPSVWIMPTTGAPTITSVDTVPVMAMMASAVGIINAVETTAAVMSWQPKRCEVKVNSPSRMAAVLVAQLSECAIVQSRVKRSVSRALLVLS